LIQITIVKKTRKESKCCMCDKVIPLGSKCISAYGFDDYNEKINEKVHPDKECYKEWFDNIDMVEPEDYPELELRKVS